MSRRFGQMLAAVALHEWLLLFYFAALVALSTLGPEGAQHAAVADEFLLFTVAAALIAVDRTGVIKSSRAQAIWQRTWMVSAVVTSVLTLSFVFEAFPQPLLDRQLLALDISLFRVEPAAYFDAWVTPAFVEWFSFFYFGCYILLASYALPLAFVERDTELFHEFVLGMLLVMVIGHLVYFLVPAKGPFAMMAFDRTLNGGMWWSLVESTFQAVGARRDVFPSLHTGFPAYLCILTWQRRARAPFRFVWPLVFFFSAQVILSTMFLRWHYLIDVVAGLALAVFASFVSRRAARWEIDHRNARGLPPVWFSIRS